MGPDYKSSPTVRENPLPPGTDTSIARRGGRSHPLGLVWSQGYSACCGRRGYLRRAFSTGEVRMATQPHLRYALAEYADLDSAADVRCE
jgi:hypothetical protein